MPRAASCLAHGGSGNAGQPCLTAALVRSRCVYGRATLSKEGTLGGVPRFDMAHEAVLVQIGESSVRTKALTSCRAPSYQQIDAATKLATWRLLARLGRGGWRRQSTKPRFIRARTAIVCVGPTTLWLSGARLLAARVVWHTCVRAACPL